MNNQNFRAGMELCNQTADGRKQWFDIPANNAEAASSHAARAAQGCVRTGETRSQIRYPSQIASFFRGSITAEGRGAEHTTRVSQEAWCCPRPGTSVPGLTRPPQTLPVPGVQVSEQGISPRPWCLHPAVLVGGGVVAAVVAMRLMEPRRNPGADATRDARAYFSRMHHSEEINPWGLSRAVPGLTPIMAEQVLDKLVREGKAYCVGSWYTPARKSR